MIAFARPLLRSFYLLVWRWEDGLEIPAYQKLFGNSVLGCSWVNLGGDFLEHGYAISSLMDTAYWSSEQESSKYLYLSSKMHAFC
ncbi:hypothetical protein Tco_1179011 [Tanacetum coccineum]